MSILPNQPRWLARIFALISALLFSDVSVMFAQPDSHTVYVAGRIGGDLEGTDPGSGTSMGVGGSFGFSFTERWNLDIEAWVPGYITDVACPPDASGARASRVDKGISSPTPPCGYALSFLVH
jgi:hypothetical protein